MSANGETVQLPTVHLGWDAASQTVHIQFDPADFKTWEMVLMVLEGGRLRAELMKRIGEMGQMQQLAQAAQQEEMIRKNLRR